MSTFAEIELLKARLRELEGTVGDMDRIIPREESKLRDKIYVELLAAHFNTMNIGSSPEDKRTTYFEWACKEVARLTEIAMKHRPTGK